MRFLAYNNLNAVDLVSRMKTGGQTNNKTKWALFALRHYWWWSIVIVHKKSGFLDDFFLNNSKMAYTILINKFVWNPGVSVYKITWNSEDKKILFQEILIILSNLLLNFVYALAQKWVWKWNFILSILILKIKANQILVEDRSRIVNI